MIEILKIKNHPSQKITQVFQVRLVKWWDSNKINYPWREFKDPYKILLSEILLRKTNAEKVRNFLPIVLSELSSFNEISKMKKARLKKLLHPFGLQAHKSNELKKIAKNVKNKYSGIIPDDYDHLIELKGIGPYIANAILCFGFNQRRPILDTNVIRIYERSFNIKSNQNRPRTDKKLWEFSKSMLPKHKVKEFNYALLDFAKKICKPRKPLCGICAINSICHFYSINFGK